jgi:hypothetical protein
VLNSTATQHNAAQQHTAPGRENFDVVLVRAQTNASNGGSSRERTSQRTSFGNTPGPWRASAVLSIASSVARTKRTRSCSPATPPSPRQAGSCFCFEEVSGVASRRKI